MCCPEIPAFEVVFSRKRIFVIPEIAKIWFDVIIPVPQNLRFDSFKEDIEGSRFPVVLGFDLDGLYAIADKGPAEEIVKKRVEKMENVLDCISASILACILNSALLNNQIRLHGDTNLQLFKDSSLFL